jgi:hypothetical protein
MAVVKTKLRYHCVSIVGGPGACAVVKALASQRLLSAEAPRLPLVGCDHPADCACIFEHHDDRRAGPRRAKEGGRLASLWLDTERRRIGGRRDSDIEDA